MQKIRSLIRRLKFAYKYLGDPPWDTGETPPEIIDHLAGVEPGKALDIGCGTGTNVIYLAQHGWEAVGVDFVPMAIREARKKATRLDVDVDFHALDVTEEFDLGQTFDFIYDIGCFHSLPFDKRPGYFDNLHRHIQPGAIYMLYGWLAEFKDNQRGIREMDIQTITEHFTCIERLDSTERGRWPSVWLKFRREMNG